MKIDILSHRNLVEHLAANSKMLDAIMIVNHNPRWANDEQAERIRLAKEHARDLLVLTFDDTTFHRDGYQAPEPRHVREALEWAKDREEFVVSCTAGKSRSSSIAYVLASKKIGPEEAIRILDPNRHIPNEWVVKHGSELLDNLQVWDLFLEYQATAPAYKW
jgi:predicted protein tyrosine phosphatase